MSMKPTHAKEILQERLQALAPAQRSKLLAELARRKAGSDRTAFPHEPRGGRYPLSHAQQRLWFISGMGDQAGAAYNISATIVFDRIIQPDLLETAFRMVLAQHEVLCSRFLEDADGSLWQEPREPANWKLAHEDLGGYDDPVAALQVLAGQVSVQAFDLSRDWLIRVVHCDLGAAQGTALIIIFHHIICDGVSIPILLDALGKAYDALLAGSTLTAGAQGHQYRDYVKWLSAVWESGGLTKHRGWWRERFQHPPEPLPLPLDHPRPSVQSYMGGLVRHSISSRVLRPFEQYCAEQGCSLFMGLLTLLQILLARYCRHNDVAIGTPVAGRVHPALETMPGLFVNTAVMRRAVDLDASFKEQLLAVRADVLGAHEHQAYPFDRLVEDLQIERDLSRSPLFDVMLGLQEEPASAFNLGGARGQLLSPAGGMSKVDLTFHCERRRSGDLVIELEYALALFARERIVRLGDLFEQLMAAICKGAVDVPVGKLPWLRDREREQVVQGFNQTTSAYPTLSLAAAFREQCARTPELPAIFYAGAEMTYAEVDAASDRLARWLRRRLDLAYEVPIAFMLERTPTMVISMLAIVKAGAAYLPLNPDTPADRLLFILRDACAAMLLTNADHLQKVAAWDGRVEDVEKLLPTLSASKVEEPVYAPSPDRLAYIMYTSGSTGQPKGTLIEQRGVLRLVLGTDYHQIQPGERVLQTGSPAFDAATFEIWGPLLNGGCCCLPAGNSLLEISDFDTLLQDSGVDTAFLTTGLFNQLADFNPDAFRLLKTVLTGGEKVSTTHMNRVRDRAPDLRLLHVYGPTENTTFSSYYEVRAAHENDVPIGRPIANSTLYVLDDFLQPVPIGVPGEIFCGGDGLARGYLGHPELTATQFLPDPFCAQPGQRMYRTGDVGAWDHDGNIRFLGRTDHQVKIRGFRIELGEVETHLRQIPGVVDALVVARPAGGTHEMVAYLVAGDADLTGSRVKAHLRADLPVYMIPAHVVFMDAFPLNASGKVDRRKLPAPEAYEGEEGAEVALPIGEVEQKLAVHWRAVLGLQEVDRQANFFAMGGDSIKAIQIVARSRGDGLHFKLADLFQHPTLADLTPYVQQQQDDQYVVETLLQDAQLAPVQKWWLETVGRLDHFNQATLLRARERLDVSKLEVCLAQLLARHAALRLSIADVEGDVRQVVGDATIWPIQVLDVSDRPSEEQLSLQKEALAVAQRSLSLQMGRLVAAVLVRRSDGDRLGLVIHHWAVDGITWRVLLDELVALLEERTLPEVTGHYTNWCASLGDWADRPSVTQYVAYWQSQAEQCQLAACPESLANAVESGTRVRVARQLSREQIVSMQESVMAAWGLDLQELLLTALARSWQQTLGRNEVSLMMEGHGRGLLPPDFPVERTAGWFTSLYPLALSLPDAPVDHVCRMVKDALRSVPDKGASYGLLRYLSPAQEIREQLGCRPRVSFNYLGAFDDAEGESGVLSHCDEDTGDDHDPSCEDPFWVDVLAWQTGAYLQIVVQGSVAPSFAEAWVDCWQREIEAIADVAKSAPVRLSLADITLEGISLAALDALLQHHDVMACAVEDVLPLTPMQAGMYYQVVLAGDTGAYTDQVVLRLQADLDVSRLEQAWHALCHRHQGLRTAIWHAPLDNPVQVVLRGRVPDVAFVDARTWTPSGREVYRARERKRGFDLERDPLMRLTVLCLEDGCYEWIVQFHHIAMDGWSSAILLQELEVLYRDVASLSSSAIPLRSYFRWHQDRKTDVDRAYWQDLLAGYSHRAEVPSLQPLLPTDTPSPAFYRFRLAGHTWSQLRHWSEEHQVTVNSIVQSLWGLMLCYWSGDWDVVFGATVSGRTAPVDGIEGLVGMLINTLPVRIQLDPAEPLRDVVGHTQTAFRESQEHSRLGLAEIQRLTTAGAGLVRHTLVFENYPGEDAASGHDPGRWHFETVDIYDPMHFDFGVLVAPAGDHLDIRFVADGSRYPLARLEAVAALFTRLTERAVADPSLPARELLAGVGDVSGSPWVVSATFTADLLLDGLRSWELAFGRAAACVSTGYDQVLQSLIDPQSTAYVPQGCRHVVLLRPADWERGSYSLEANLDLLVDAVGSYARAVPRSHVLLVVCPDAARSAAELVPRLQRRLERLPQVKVFDAAALLAAYDVGDMEVPDADAAGGIPYTEAFFAALAAGLYRAHEALQRLPVKVFAVDADETLWGGIVGEDGVDGIRVEACHRKLGQYLAHARDAGKLLCLVTKNNPEDVDAVFAKRKDLPLQREQFTAIYAGWGDKSESLRRLARELNLGLDSVVFLDDSPLECAAVRKQCPAVQTILLPDSARRERFLDHLWLLDAGAVTREDAARATMMTTEQQRQALAVEAGSFGDFLAGLAVEVDLHPLLPEEVDRVAQLTQRTNQFHTRTLRFQVHELAQWCAQDGQRIFTATVQDRFGAYGLTGVAMVALRHDVPRIVNMLLSCRVLGRGVEHTLVRELGALTGTDIDVCFTESGRNRPARRFLESSGAVLVGTEGEIQLYRFSADALQRLTPDQDAGLDTPEIETATVSQGDVAHFNYGRFYEWIAVERNSVDSLLGDLIALRATAGGIAVQSGTALQTDEELLLGQIWCELLGVSQVWRESNFYALGGHSLLAVMLLARLQHRHGILLTLDDVQSASTLAELACLMKQVHDAGRPALTAIPDADFYPLSHSQHRLWMIEQMRAEGPSPFHMAACFVVDTALPVACVEDAICAIIMRHDVLRTAIVEREGRPVQVVHADTTFAVEELAGICSEQDFPSLCADVIMQPFDLCQPPLIRVAMAQLAGGAMGLCLVMHHIISDGWSVGVMAQEMTAVLAGQPLVALPLQYRDYAAWQERYLDSSSGEHDRQFWLNALCEMPAPLALPIQPAVRPPIKMSDGASVLHRISPEIWAGVKMLCEQLQVTPYGGLLAATHILLGRYSGQDVLITGTPVAGRQHPDLEPLIGFFVNVLPVVARIDPQVPLAGYLQALGKQLNQVLMHQDYPFDALVDELDLPRDMSRAPLFDVLVVLQNAAMDLPEIEGARARALMLPSRTSQYDLVFNAFEEAGGLDVVLEYDTALFVEADIERMLRQLEIMLAQMVKMPSSLVKDLTLLDAAGMKEIAAFEGMPAPALPSLQTMPAILLRMASERPDAEALRCAGRSWTYTELAAAMDVCAQQVLAQVQSGSVVGVLGVASAENVIAMLGILRAGCIYLPLDPDSPEERLRFMATDSGLALCLTTGMMGEHAIAYLPGVPLLDVNSCLSASIHENIRSLPEPSDTAYLIYTSGSTGKPKAVAVSHLSFCSMIAEQCVVFDVVPDDVVGQFASHAFDASLSEFFLAFYRGACLQIPGAEVKQSVDAFLAWLQSEGVTVLTLPPAFLRGLERADLGMLRVLITAGEAADPADAAFYADRLRYVNAYGPTETAVCATAYRVTQGGTKPVRVPIGRPLPCTRVLLLDPCGQRVPVGVPGELYVGGPTVAVGYANRPDLTTERFVDNPFGIPAGRCYRTGDVCMWLPDGNLVFLRRVDDQCKIRGYRIEPGEVEVALRACAGVRDAVVVPDGNGGLPAWYAGDVEPSHVRDELARHLPSYMLPMPLIQMKELPRTVNGKLDRANLPLAVACMYEEPVSKQEGALAAAWHEVLGGDVPGRQSDYFLCGGDSIKALRVVSHLRVAGWSITLKQLFAHPVLADAALCMRPVSVGADRAPLDGIVPLLPIQKWFFAAHQDSPLAHFNQAVVLRCREPVEVAVLQAALSQLCVLHDSLRARYYLSDQGWVQEIVAADAYRCPLQVEDWSGLSATAYEKEFAALDHALNTGFRLEDGQLLRAVVIRAADGDALVLVGHHLITDWVSWRILIEDLEKLYAGESVGYAPHALGALADRDGGAEAESSRCLQAACTQALGVWMLDAGSYGAVRSVSAVLDVHETEALRDALLRQESCGLQDGLLAAFVGALGLMTGLPEIPILLDRHGRDSFGPDSGIDRTTGWFTLLLPVLLPGQISRKDCVVEVRERTRVATEKHSGYLRNIPDERLPVLASFNFLGGFDAVAEERMFTLSDVSLRETLAASFARDCPLAFSGYVINGCLHWQVTGGGAIMDRIALETLAQHVTMSLAEMSNA